MTIYDFENQAIDASGYPITATRLLGSFSRNPSSLFYLNHWIKSLQTQAELDVPWITYGALHWLKRRLRPESRVFEYGSGASTVWLSERCGFVWSVEHDKAWYEEVESRVTQYKSTHLVFRPSEAEAKGGECGEYRSQTFPEYRGLSFENYVKEITRFPDGSFDFVLIDGRAREACLQAARTKIKQSGYIILDNSERANYWEAATSLGYRTHRHYFGIGPKLKTIWRTSILTPAPPATC